MLRIRKRGQSIIEYAFMITIIMGAFLAVGYYFKRGIQGRWKAVVDDMGDQYDPGKAATLVRHLIISNTETRISVESGTEGSWTSRTDLTNTVETRGGEVTIDP